MSNSYSYYTYCGWIDVDDPDEAEYFDYEEQRQEVRLTYFPPYYFDENVTIYIDVKEFDKPDPIDYWFDDLGIETWIDEA